jgi:hypothetical protein
MQSSSQGYVHPNAFSVKLENHLAQPPLSRWRAFYHFKRFGVRDYVEPITVFDLYHHFNPAMAGFPVCPLIFEAHMLPDNPYTTNLPVSPIPPQPSFSNIVPSLPFSVLQPVDGSSDNSKQGKVAELRQELNGGGKKDKNHSAKKITLKKIVANMTMSNNDMVALFPDIVNCMQIPSLEIKKMYVPPCICSNSSGRC